MTTTTPARVVEQWRSMQSAYLQTAGALERALNDGFDLGLSEFEVLDLLAEKKDAECVMRDLLPLTPMTQSALSRVVDRLQKAGLVARNECSYDRRSMFVGLTEKGAALHRDAAAVYRSLLTESLA